MKIGVVLMLSDLTPSVEEIAPMVEERSFYSLSVGEHTHLPVDTVHSYTKGRYAGRKARDGYVPDFYKRFPDPYITLAAAAACTSTIRIGTCIALPAEHNPIILAKVIATLDRQSGGRFEFGIGYGWNPLEMSNNGFDKADRRRVIREKILAMKALWTQPTASFEGEFVKFTESYSYPKPTQEPHPPIFLGAAPSAANLADVVDWADGWIPVRSFMGDKLAEGVTALRQKAESVGRDPADFKITIVDPEGSMGGKRSPEEFAKRLVTAATLDSYRDLGIHRLTLGIPVHDVSALCWAMDQVVELRETVGI